MPKGKTTIMFKGGMLDGQQFDETNTRLLKPTITIPSNTFMAATATNKIDICNGKLNTHWIWFKADVYEKQLRTDDTKPFVYLFKDELIVNRCVAMTKKGTRCMHPAQAGKTYCGEVHKENVENTP